MELKAMEAVELNPEELERAAGGKYRPLPPKEGYIVYQIQRGDTLGKIARRFNITADEIAVWNPKISNKNLIYAGDYLYIKQ